MDRRSDCVVETYKEYTNHGLARRSCGKDCLDESGGRRSRSTPKPALHAQARPALATYTGTVQRRLPLGELRWGLNRCGGAVMGAYYRIRRGDCLSSIAKHCGLSGFQNIFPPP